MLSPPILLLLSLLTLTRAQSDGGGGQRCGRVMFNTEDRIIHRPADGDGERCSWILNVPQATDYEVKLTSIGSSAELITVMAFTEEKTTKQKILEVNKDYLFHGRILVITYSINSTSSNVNPTGFKLSYSSRLTVDDSDVQVLASIFPGSPTDVFAAPNGFGSDSATIIVQSPLSRATSTEFYSLTLNATQLNSTSNSRCCSDSVVVWAFNSGVWYRHAKLCGQEPPNVMYINRDIFMISYTRENPSTLQGISYRFSDKMTENKKVFRKSLIP